MNQRSKVFISYSHKDEAWLERLQIHLKPLTRSHQIEIWDDSRIEAGSLWRQEIGQAVASAFVVVLLISADYLASDFIANDELPPLLKAAGEEGAVILPVILSPCWFSKVESLAQFQAVNNPANPLINASRGEQEATFVRVAEHIEAAFAARRMETALTQMHERVEDIFEKVAKLFAYTMSGPMFENLKKMARPEGFGPYTWSKGLERELYHLRDIGYIAVIAVQDIPRKGENLSDHVKVLEIGREFVELRESMGTWLHKRS